MTRILMLAVVVLAAACSSPAPTSPAPPTGPNNPAPSPPPAPAPPPAAPRAWLWTMVVEESGACIADATFEIVAGQSVGRGLPQEMPCGAWSYSGGALFRDLIEGVELTLRASAPGYVVEEKVVVPTSGGQQALLFTPARIR